jgi:hypothetical protein
MELVQQAKVVADCLQPLFGTPEVQLSVAEPLQCPAKVEP